MQNRTVVVATLLAFAWTAGCAGSDGDAPRSDCAAVERPGGGAAPLVGALPAGATWQWQLTDAIEHGLDVSIYDVDLFDTDPAEIAELQTEGHLVICYLSAGSHEDWRDDAGAFDPAVIGRRLDGWDGERWLDVRAESVRTIMADRIAEAAARGCDGVEPDNVDGWVNDTGFPLTRADQLAFNTWLADEAHGHGLLILLKNAPELVPDLVDVFDGSLNEECLTYDECDAYRPFLEAGKVVLHVEYLDAECDDASRITSVCEDPSRAGFSTLVKEWDLGAWGIACANP